MNRAGLASSAAGALILGAVVLRSAMPAPVAPPTQTLRAEQKVAAKVSRASGVAKKKSKPVAGEYPEDGPWKASREHFAGAETNPCQSQQVRGDKKQVASLSGVNLLLQGDGHPATIDHPRKQLWCIPDAQRVQAMIAIAPDPAHTNLSLIFDRSLEAIQLAAKSADYLVDRYWLPWDATAKTDWADYASLEQATADQDQKEKQPGLLLFRWNGDPKVKGQAVALYVFLVGDTSTAGINGEQFRNAVRYVDQVCATEGRAAGCVQADPIFIMGPTFSGSLDSLGRLAQASEHKFSVYSGTVSSLGAQKNQASLFKDLGLKFKPLVTETESAVNQFLFILQNDHDIQCQPPEVAILSETATAYGGAIEQAKKEGKEDPCFTTFVYPREIASLRNAYEASGAQKNTPAGSTAGTQSPYLSLNLADQTNRSDEPPDFSTVQGPLSKEAVLMNYAAEMRREHYKYIGVSATNALDALFLANFFRTAVPDARLFVLNSDLLFERELDNAPYVGTLAITTYPLLLRGLDCAGKTNSERLPFADQYQQGQYNAGLLAIGDSLGYTTAQFNELCGCPDAECSRGQRPLWLTVAGTGGYWPVRKLAGPSSITQAAQLDREGFSGAWQIVVLSLCALALLQAGLLFNVSPLRNRFRDFSLLNDEAGQRLFFIHVASASLVLALVMLAAPVWRSTQVWSPLTAFFILAVVAMVLACVLLEFNYVLRWRRERPWRLGQPEPVPGTLGATQSAVVKQKADPPGDDRNVSPAGWKVALQFGGSLVVWVIAGVLAYFWHSLVAEPNSDYGLFFGYRTLHMATGVSPFTPLLPLLSAIYFWGLCEVWRLRFNDMVRPRLKPIDNLHEPAGEPDLGKLRPGWAMEPFIARAVRAYTLNPGYMACFIILFGAWFSFFAPWHAFDLFEQRPFGWIYEFLFCSVMALILSSGFRLAQIWTELHKLLLELKTSRVRFAFSRLKDHNWSPIWRQGSEDAEWSYMVRSFECLQEIANCEASDPTLKTASAAMREKVIDIRRAIARLAVNRLVPRTLQTTLEYLGRSKTNFSEEFCAIQRKVQGLQNDLATVLAKLLDRLQNAWETQCPAPGDLEEEAGEQAQVEVHCCQEKRDDEAEQRQRIERYVALRYVAFIRSVLGRIRYLLIFLAVSFSLLMISLNVYSFEPHQALIWAVTAVFVVVGCITIVVLMQVHRDYILSSITGTAPNKLGLEFYLRIVALGVVPLLTLLSTHFPSVGRHLLALLQPGLEALK
jgi:hypothetical protein